MSPAIRIEDNLWIPAEVGDFEAFQRWACSDGFPERGRIDFLQGIIEVDMCPEELQSHGALKVELVSWLHRVVKSANLGQVFADRTRLSCPPVGLSCEPDVLFVSLEALRTGAARYQAGPDRFVEVEGAATLVVEVVSDSSVGKDTERLPPLYAAAGILELWIADARGQKLSLQILHLEARQYRPADVDADGFQPSHVLGRRIRLRREPWELPGTWSYFIDEAPASR